MKKTFRYLSFLIFTVFFMFSFSKNSEEIILKCMIQMINYEGEGAYVVISLIDPEGNYEETLYVQGKDTEWYSDIIEWWKFYGKYRPNIDAISGETIKGGERSIAILKVPLNKINEDYSIRFETAVEDQEYFETDLQFKLTTENLQNKIEGQGYIRYIKVIAK